LAGAKRSGTSQEAAVPSRSPSRRPVPLRLAAAAVLAAAVAGLAAALLTPPAAASPWAQVRAAAAGRAPLPGIHGQRPAARVPPLRAPVRGPVVRGFELPSGPYGPGHRGVDLAAPLGAPADAPAGGRVVFAGPVAGLDWVSVEVAPGVVVTVGPLDRPAVRAGSAVPALARLGRLAAGHDGRLHLGLRVDGAYVDPLPYLVGNGPPRLAPLPLEGTAASA
jgi:murein DD-endopeptidase MepM/ murein hydrolase activator NlpD